MRYSNLILTLIVLFSGCRIYHDYPREFADPKETYQAYDAEIELADLKNRVADQDTFFLSNFMVTQAIISPENQRLSKSILDIEPERFFEIMDVFRYEYKNRIESQKNVTLPPKITILEYREGGSLSWKLLTAFTMGIPCLVGMPANWTSTFVKIELAYYDESGNMVSSTWGEGYNKTWVAMYWGFGADARTRSVKLATQEALSNLKH